MPASTRKPKDVIEDNFGIVWPVHLAAFTRLLTRLRSRFDGDLDLLLVLAAISERTRRETWTPELLSHRDLIIGTDGEDPQAPINIQSVSDYTGIPRETVRRKVGTLIGKGWILRHGDGSLSVRKQAAEDLEDATDDTLVYLSALFQAFENVRLDRADP